MNMRHAVSVGMLLVCQLSLSVAAQDTDGELAALYGDEESLSIATGSSKPIHLAPSVATVITAEDIAAHGASDLDQVLEMVPGLHVSSSFNRLNSIYSIRGIHTGQNPQVLMLLDGVPITQYITGGRPNTFRMPVANVSRVEVIRGPGSAVYGADAYAGVINVITKRADDIDGTRFGVGAGSSTTQGAWAQYGSKSGAWETAFSAEWQRSDGDRNRTVDRDLQSTLDTTFGTAASNAPGALDTRYNIVDTHLNLSRDHWNVALWGWTQRDGGVGPGAAQALDPTGYTDVTKFLADISYRTNEWAQGWEVTTRLTHQYLNAPSHFVVLPDGAVVPIGMDGNLFSLPYDPSCAPGPCLVTFPEGVIGNTTVTDYGTAWEVTGIYDGWLGHRLRLSGGMMTQREDTSETKNFGPGVIDGTQPVVNGTLTDVSGTNFVFMKDQERDIWFASAQDEWAFAPDWELTAGIRYDHYSDFGSTSNPRVALVWSTTHNLTSKLLYGRAFRAPSFSELYYENNPALWGNPDLLPETIDTTELAFDYRPAFNTRLGFSLFSYDADKLIDFVKDPVSGIKYATNTPGRRGVGYEIEADWRPVSAVRMFGNVAVQDTEYKSDGTTVPDAPGWHMYLGADWAFATDWKASLQANWVADRVRAAGDTRKPVDDYSLLHLTLRRMNVARQWDFGATVHNLLDAKAYEPSDPRIPGDYRLPGRFVYVDIRLHL